MIVALVGGRGQVGTDLGPLLEAAGHQVRVFGRDELPVQHRERVLAVMAQMQPDAIVNCSVFHPVDRCESEAAECFAVNALGPWHLALAAKQLGARLIHFSSDYVFDGEAERPYLESDVPSPHSVFGVAKVAGEQLIRVTWDRHAILRTSGLYGIAGSRVKGGNFVETMLRLGRERGRAEVVHDLRMAQTATRNLACQTLTLLEAGASGTFHASDHGSCSWFEFAQMIFEEAGMKVEVTPVPASAFPAAAPRPKYSVLASERLGAMGLDRMQPIRVALREYLCARERAHGR